MKTFIGVLVALFSTAVFADPRICARDYAAKGGDICAANASPRHKYVLPEREENPPICVITYEMKFCKEYKQEYVQAITAEDEIVCIVNFNQPTSVGNYCGADPKSFKYAKDPWKRK